MRTISSTTSTPAEENWKNHIGKDMSVHGMIYKIRKMSGFAFILLQTRIHMLQGVWSEKDSHFALDNLREGMAVVLSGQIVLEERSRNGWELHIRSYQILSKPVAEFPIVVNQGNITTSMENLLDYRPLTLRNQKQRAIFKIQAGLCAGFRHFFNENGFTEIHTPKICAGTAEGGANVFRLDYFGKEAFLATSPQFYKQEMVSVYERVYEIGPVFRAEKFDTSRHINEYTSIDCEIGFIQDFYDLMRLEIQMLASVMKYLSARYSEELRLLQVNVPQIGEIPVIPFAKAKAMVTDENSDYRSNPVDFEPGEEKRLCEIVKNETGCEFVFVTQYPSSKRPFYTMDSPNNSETTESFDLLFRGMEITTGGQRIHDYARQIAKMKTRHMDTQKFSSYLMAHKFCLPPHGGMGIGMERLTAKLLGLDNVRYTTLFPRDTKRLEP